MGVVVEIGIIVLIDYTPVGSAVFGTAPIPPSVWLFMISCAAANAISRGISQMAGAPKDHLQKKSGSDRHFG
jgi:hypothetical protein